MSLIGVGDLRVKARVVGRVGHFLMPAVWQQNVVPALGHVAVSGLAVAKHLRLLAVAAGVRHLVPEIVVRVLVTVLLIHKKIHQIYGEQ